MIYISNNNKHFASLFSVFDSPAFCISKLYDTANPQIWVINLQNPKKTYFHRRKQKNLNKSFKVITILNIIIDQEIVVYRSTYY